MKKEKNPIAVGTRIGRLVVIGDSIPSEKPNRRYPVLCDCGVETTILKYSLTGSKPTLSCGCLQREVIGNIARTHGMSDSREYSAWENMLTRCNNQNSENYADYGQRGIVVCEEWKDFNVFFADMGSCPINYELDRVNVNGNYNKENCRWVNSQLQSWNKRLYKNNKSGKSGVTWNNKLTAWECRISKGGRVYYLGRFYSLDLAIKRREEAEVELYGSIKN